MLAVLSNFGFRLFYVMDQSIKGKVLPENLAPEVGIAFFTRFRSDFVENEELLRAYHPQVKGISSEEKITKWSFLEIRWKDYSFASGRALLDRRRS
jgi:hypothetical protein